MAAPPSIDIRDLSGKWTMNKTLSDPSEKILELQGVSWITRKAIAMGTITLSVSHYSDDQGVEHIDVDQTITGGFEGTREQRILDWTDRKHQDHLFGYVVGKSKREKVENFEHEFLKKDWTPDTVEHSVVCSHVESDTEKSGTIWIAIQTWGFEEVNQERRYTRHVYFTGPKGEVIEARLVYDYLGPVDSK